MRSVRSRNMLLQLAILVLTATTMTEAILESVEQNVTVVGRTKQVQREMLERMGLRQIPRRTVTEERRKELMRELGDWMYESEADKSDPDAVYLFASKSEMRYDDSSLAALFQASRETMDKSIQGITLQIGMRTPANYLPEDGDREIHVNVYEVRDGETPEEIATRKIPLRDTVRSHKARILLDIGDAERWFHEEKKSDVHIFVEAKFDGENIAILPSDTDYSNEMYLKLEVGARAKRTRRQAQCTLDMNEKACCLYDNTVSFKEIGWDFVVAPLRYNAFACAGDCKYNRQIEMELENPKIVNDRILNRDDFIPVKCCHPSQYQALSMVYLNDDGEVITAKIPGMIATKCTCS